MAGTLKGDAASKVGDQLEQHIGHHLEAKIVYYRMNHNDEPVYVRGPGEPGGYGYDEVFQETYPKLVCVDCGQTLLKMDE